MLVVLIFFKYTQKWFQGTVTVLGITLNVFLQLPCILYWFDTLVAVNVYSIDRRSVRLKLLNILHQCYIHHHCDIIQSSLILWIQKPVRHRLRPPSLSQNALHLEFLHITNRCWLIMYRFPSTTFWWSVVYSLQTPQITLAEHKEDSLCFHYYLM